MAVFFPLNNLGLIREKINRLDDAVKAYEEALRLAPDNPEVVANLARVYVRMGRRDQKVRDLLAEVFARDERPAWQHWRRPQISRSGEPAHQRLHEPTGRRRRAERRVRRGRPSRTIRADREASAMFEKIRWGIMGTGQIARCLREGLTESPVMPLDESIHVMEIMDQVRRQWGLVYPQEE